MKLFMSFLLAIVLFSQSNKSYAISFSKPDTASLSPSASSMKTSEFIKLSPRDFALSKGKKLSFFEKVSLRVLQMKMKRYLKKKPDSTVADYYKSAGEGNFNLLWFLAGLLVPLLSVFIQQSLVAFILVAVSPIILALILKQDRVAMKSVLLGFGSALVFLLIFGLLLAAAWQW